MQNESKKLLFRFFLPYLAVLIVPTFISYVAYIEAFRSVRFGVHTTNRMLLERTVENVDRSLAEIDNLVFAIASNPKVTRFLQISDFLDTQNYTFMRELQRQLPPFQITHNLIFRYFIYFKRSNVILSPETIAFRLPLFYRDSLNYEDMRYDQWYDLLSGQYHDRRVLPPTVVSIEGRRRQLITYLQSIPMGYSGIFDGTIAVLLDKKTLQRMLASLNLHRRSWVALLDESYVPLAVVGAQPEEITDAMTSLDASRVVGGDAQDFRFNDERYQLMTMRSDRTGWILAVGVPRAVIRSRVRRVQRLAYGVTVLSVIGGTLLALMLAHNSSKPIRLVFRLLHAEPDIESGGGIDLSSLQPAVARLISRNRHLQWEIRRQEPFVRNAIFERLLRGERMDGSDELQSLIDLRPFDTHARNYLCLILHIRGFDGPMSQERIRDLNVARVIVHDAVDRFFGSSCCLHDIQMDRIVLLLHFDIESDRRCYEYVDERCSALKKHLDEEYRFHCSISGGCLVTDVESVFRSYCEARQAASSAPAESPDAVDYFTPHDPSSNVRYRYPLEVERAILAGLLSGHLEDAREKIEEVRRENFQRRKISRSLADNLFVELQGTILKLLEKEGVFTDRDASIIHRAAEELLLVEEIDAFFESLDALVVVICRMTSDRKRSHNRALLERVVSEVRKSYCDPDLTLGRVSGEIGLSEVYLSQFFKEQTGENFTGHLTRIRVEKAKEILHGNRTLTIDEVARTVGYSSADTFRKAFRRVYGISPTRARLVSGTGSEEWNNPHEESG